MAWLAFCCTQTLSICSVILAASLHVDGVCQRRRKDHESCSKLIGCSTPHGPRRHVSLQPAAAHAVVDSPWRPGCARHRAGAGVPMFDCEGGVVLSQLTFCCRLCQTAAIQLNLRLAVSAESFFGPNLVNDLSSKLGCALKRGKRAAHSCQRVLRSPPSHSPIPHPHRSSSCRVRRRHGERPSSQPHAGIAWRAVAHTQPAASAPRADRDS